MNRVLQSGLLFSILQILVCFPSSEFQQFPIEARDDSIQVDNALTAQAANGDLMVNNPEPFSYTSTVNANLDGEENVSVSNNAEINTNGNDVSVSTETNIADHDSCQDHNHPPASNGGQGQSTAPAPGISFPNQTNPTKGITATTPSSSTMGGTTNSPNGLMSPSGNSNQQGPLFIPFPFGFQPTQSNPTTTPPTSTSGPTPSPNVRGTTIPGGPPSTGTLVSPQGPWPMQSPQASSTMSSQPNQIPQFSPTPPGTAPNGPANIGPSIPIQGSRTASSHPYSGDQNPFIMPIPVFNGPNSTPSGTGSNYTPTSTPGQNPMSTSTQGPVPPGGSQSTQSPTNSNGLFITPMSLFNGPNPSPTSTGPTPTQGPGSMLQQSYPSGQNPPGTDQQNGPLSDSGMLSNNVPSTNPNESSNQMNPLFLPMPIPLFNGPNSTPTDTTLGTSPSGPGAAGITPQTSQFQQQPSFNGVGNSSPTSTNSGGPTMQPLGNGPQLPTGQKTNSQPPPPGSSIFPNSLGGYFLNPSMFSWPFDSASTSTSTPPQTGTPGSKPIPPSPNGNLSNQGSPLQTNVPGQNPSMIPPTISAYPNTSGNGQGFPSPLGTMVPSASQPSVIQQPTSSGPQSNTQTIPIAIIPLSSENDQPSSSPSNNQPNDNNSEEQDAIVIQTSIKVNDDNASGGNTEINSSTTVNTGGDDCDQQKGNTNATGGATQNLPPYQPNGGPPQQPRIPVSQQYPTGTTPPGSGAMNNGMSAGNELNTTNGLGTSVSGMGMGTDGNVASSSANKNLQMSPGNVNDAANLNNSNLIGNFNTPFGGADVPDVNGNLKGDNGIGFGGQVGAQGGLQGNGGINVLGAQATAGGGVSGGGKANGDAFASF